MSEAAVTCQCGATLIASDRNSVVVAMRVSDFYKAHAVCNERSTTAPSVADPSTACPSCDHPWERHIVGAGVLAGERHCKPGCGCERRPPATNNLVLPHRDNCVHPTIDRHGITGMCPVAQDDKGWSTLWAARPGYRRDDP